MTVEDLRRQLCRHFVVCDSFPYNISHSGIPKDEVALEAFADFLESQPNTAAQRIAAEIRCRGNHPSQLTLYEEA